MPRLIVLLLIILVMAALAIQNSTAFPLVVLGSYTTPAIPLGLMLVGAVVLGSLITLILYGLIGLRRPPESKYRPIGSRVPYPASPGSTDLPPSGPAHQPPAATYSAPAPSTAFVSEPSPPPQDSAPTASPPADSSRYGPEYSAESYRPEPYTPPYQSAYAAADSTPESAANPAENFIEPPIVPPSDPIITAPSVTDRASEPLPSPEPRSTIVNPFSKKKRVKAVTRR